MDEPATPPSPPTAAPAVPAARAWLGRRTAWVVAAALLLGLAALAGLARWTLYGEAGTRWLLGRVPQLEAIGFRGALLGGSWQAERLRLRWGDTQSITIEGLSADGLRWTWRPHDQAWVGLGIQRLRARKVTVVTGPPGTQALQMPRSIALPLQFALADGGIETLVIDALSPMSAVSVRGLVLDARPGTEHSVEQAGMDWQGVRVLLQGSIGTAAPMPLTAQASLRSAREAEAPPWAAVIRASGNLNGLDVAGTLRGVPRDKRAVPALDVRAAVRPFEAWPLGAVSLRTEALDLAALTPAAPATRLTGSAELASSARDAPLTATVALTNALPGRWNEGRLPLQRLSAELHGQISQPDRVELRHFELAFADGARTAGRWTGSALWQGHELSLRTELQGVTPQRLDSRAAAMTLSGPVAATLRGLPSPDPAATGTTPTPHIDWSVDLKGQIDAAPQPVRLELEGSADDQRLELKRLRATSGDASAEVHAVLARTGSGPWRMQTTGKLSQFDPRPWWPGEPGSAWRAGPHRFSADWHLELQLPAEAERMAPVALAQRLSGNGKLNLHDSVLAGVPLAAELTLGYTRAAAPASGTLRGELQLGGNQITFDGRGDPTGSGEADHWHAELKAETLATLAPLARLHPALAHWVPQRGSASAVLTADGRWPALHTDGSIRVQQLKAGTLALPRGQASWHLGTGGRQALALQIELIGIELGARRADHVRADIHGTLAEHQIDVAAAAPVLPPPLAAQLLGVELQSGTRAQLQAQGSWQAEDRGGGRWRGHVERLILGSWDGGAGTAPPASAWIEARDLRTELQFAPGGELVAVQASPGRMQFGDAMALHWGEVRLDLGGERAGIDLHADIEPFAVAPLLARAHPAAGWEGDLKLAARVNVRAAERFDADLVFERQSGDLTLSGSEGSQLLGLTEARLALSAHDGVWTVTPAFKGRTLGEISGSARVQTTPERFWPHAEAPVEGGLQARVANVGIWSGWLPPGWRLTGELRTAATLGGRFGEPRYTGEITGTGLGLRNLLQGVSVNDGQLTVRLDGDMAQIEHCTLHGGEGTVTIAGGATLNREPRARLQILAERFRVLGRVDRTLVASGNAELSLQSEQGRLEGSFRIDEGLYDTSRGNAPTLDEDVTVHRPGDVEAAPTDAAPPRPRRNFVLDVDLDLGEKLRIRGSGLDTALRGRLKLSTPGGRLAVNGSINAENGTYAAYGQKLTIERGIVTFGGPADNPRLDVLALRPNIDTRVGVSITGNLLTPRVRLYSDPDISDTDKLSWLVLGRAPDGLGRNETALLQRAAVALLAGDGEAPTDALMKSLGIDELSLHQGDSDVRETVVSLGKQLSRRWYLGYERGVNSTTGTWQLIYRIAQRFTLRAQSGLENALDVIWIWRAQETPPDAGLRKSSVLPP